MKTKSKKAKAESANYLDYVPMHNEDKYPFQTDDNGAVTIMVENKGVFNKIAQVVFRKPYQRFILMKWVISYGHI